MDIGSTRTVEFLFLLLENPKAFFQAKGVRETLERRAVGLCHTKFEDKRQTCNFVVPAAMAGRMMSA